MFGPVLNALFSKKNFITSRICVLNIAFAGDFYGNTRYIMLLFPTIPNWD